MKKYAGKNLNVKRLLELGDLDIRGIAAQNEKLVANEYFSKVEEFIENAPRLIEVLSGVSELAENVKALKEMESKLGVAERSVNFAEDTERLKDLENIKDILTEIGYNKLNFHIDSICNEIKSGNLQQTEKLSYEAYLKLSTLLDRIKSVHLIKKFEHAQTEYVKGHVPNNTVLLREALDYFDYEEANRKLRILAVDDVSVVLNTITSMLSPYYEVFALKKSSQVEKFLKVTRPELFLLDIEMHEVDGFDLVPLIRQFEEHKDTPIIFLTGNASYDNLKGAVSLGACDFIKKPVTQDLLIEKIEKNIVRKKAF